MQLKKFNYIGYAFIILKILFDAFLFHLPALDDVSIYINNDLGQTKIIIYLKIVCEN